METTVYIFNMSEDVWPFIAAMADPAARAAEIDENADLGDRELFSLADEHNILFIAPKPVSPEFFDYTTDLLGTKNVRVISPRVHSGVICEDILRDDRILSALSDAANSSRRLALTSYTTSMQFLSLARTLRKRGLTVTTPESPEWDDAWTVNFYGSKSGIRQLAQQSRAVEPDFLMADGLICSGITDAAKIAAKKYIKENGVVIKTNKGHSGAGVLIFRPGDLPGDYNTCEQEIYRKLTEDPYWEKFPIIIEDFIQITPAIGGGFPNVEFKIQKNGHIEFLYYCGMRITKDGVFRGVEIHNEVVSDRTAAQMVDTGFFIAERYSAAGYRGYFDVDFVAGRSGTLYVTESNVRKTGGTHVYHTALRLFGRDFMYLTYILSHTSYSLPYARPPGFPDMLETLRPVLYDRETKEGLVVVSENLLTSRNTLAYIIFGKNKKRALEIEEEMEGLIRSR
ncbi:hypothetical protein M1555_04615 [Patescibacteria group bacterium]|nr:hypothetical protein [Patescibacteria group bacterium]